MKTLLLIQVLLILLASCSSSQNEKLTVDEIWQNYLDSIGKKEDLLKITTYSATILSDSKFGESRINIKTKYPDKVYTEILYPNNALVTFIINGDSGIIKSPKGIENIPQSDLIKYREGDKLFPELDFKKLGYTIILFGEEKIRGRDCYNLEIDKKYETINYLIDKENFQVLRTMTGANIFDYFETVKIDGINLIKTSRNITGTDTITSNYIELKLNIEIDNNLFKLK